MTVTKERQQHRDDWVERVVNVRGLSDDVLRHCLSKQNLEHWWPGTQPSPLEIEHGSKEERKQ